MLLIFHKGRPRGIDVHLNSAEPIGTKAYVNCDQSEDTNPGGLFEVRITQTASRFTTRKKACESRDSFWVFRSEFLQISPEMANAYFFR